MKKRLLFFAVLILPFCLNTTSAQQEKGKSPDTIKILNVSSAAPIVRGVEVEISVNVEYNFKSGDEGMISIGFNTDRPQAFRMFDTLIIKKGTKVVALKAKVVPVDWSEKGKFTALAIVTKSPAGTEFTPSGTDTRVIPIGN